MVGPADLVNNVESQAQRAWDRFESATDALNAAVLTMGLLRSMPGAHEHLAASIRLRRGGSTEHSSEQYELAAEEVLDDVDAEINRDCTTIKEAALVAACSSFEYLIKAFFVDSALEDSAAAADKLRTLRLKLEVADVLGASPVEQWFRIADHAFEELGRRTPHMVARVKSFLLDYTAFPGPAGTMRHGDVEKAFADMNAQTFNKAFLTRNCIVHNGGRADARLARSLGTRAGEPLTYPKGYVRDLIKPLRHLGAVLSPLWSVTL